jgi:transcription elongation factor Elf1
MMIARIEPHTYGYNMRTFECPNCNHSESEVVKFG